MAGDRIFSDDSFGGDLNDSEEFEDEDEYYIREREDVEDDEEDEEEDDEDDVHHETEEQARTQLEKAKVNFQGIFIPSTLD